jgi:hypothetical protein
VSPGDHSWPPGLQRARVRLDPLDAKPSRHAPECEFVSETDAAVLRAISKVRDGAGGVTGGWSANSCATGWQVAHNAAEAV